MGHGASNNAAMHFALMQASAAAAGKIMANKLPARSAVCVIFGHRFRVRLDRAGISPRFEIRVPLAVIRL
jgi:hypothetical protein